MIYQKMLIFFIWIFFGIYANAQTLEQNSDISLLIHYSWGFIAKHTSYTITIINHKRSSTTFDLIQKTPEHHEYTDSDLDAKIVNHTCVMWKNVELLPKQKRTIKVELLPKQAGKVLISLNLIINGKQNTTNFVMDVYDKTIPRSILAKRTRYILLATKKAKVLLQLDRPWDLFSLAIPYKLSLINQNRQRIYNLKLTTYLPKEWKLINSNCTGINNNQAFWEIGKLSFQPYLAHFHVAIGRPIKSMRLFFEFQNKSYQIFQDKPHIKTGMVNNRIPFYDTNDPCMVTEKTTYILEIDGNIFPITTVKIIVQSPDSKKMKFISAIASTNYKQKGNEIIFEEIPILYPAEKIHCKINYLAFRPGDVRCIVKMTCDQFHKTMIFEEPTSIYSDY